MTASALAFASPLVSPGHASHHQRYKSSVSAISDSYSRTAAAQQRRQAIARQQAAHAARLAAQQRERERSELRRQFLVRELILASVNKSKKRRIDLEVRAGLRSGRERRTDEPWFEPVPVLVDEWHCSGAKARILEAEDWKDKAKTAEAERCARLLEERDRLRAAQLSKEQGQRRHSEILSGFLQQKENNARAQQKVHDMFHGRPWTPLHLSPPTSYLDTLKGREQWNGTGARSGARSVQRGGEEAKEQEDAAALTLPALHRSFPSSPAALLKPGKAKKPAAVSLPLLKQSRRASQQSSARRKSVRHEEKEQSTEREEEDQESPDADRVSRPLIVVDGCTFLTELDAEHCLGPSSPLQSDLIARPPPPLLSSSSVSVTLSSFEQRLKDAALQLPPAPVYLSQ